MVSRSPSPRPPRLPRAFATLESSPLADGFEWVGVETGGDFSGQSAGNTGEDTSNLICIVGPHTYTGPYQATAGNAGAG